jgi:hypothetical protein
MLYREARMFQRDKEKYQSLYPFLRAEELAKQLRQLSDEEDYLELTRKRITQIGNTLGFVRLIKNASLKDN